MLANQDQYLSARAEALQNVERTITELVRGDWVGLAASYHSPLLGVSVSVCDIIIHQLRYIDFLKV